MKHLENFNNFVMNESEYIPDQDNILQIMKDKYGYGDLSYERMEEFERTVYSLISSDEEYAKKFDEFIKENNVKIAQEELKRFDDNFEKRIIKMHIHDYNHMRKNLADKLTSAKINYLSSKNQNEDKK